MARGKDTSPKIEISTELARQAFAAPTIMHPVFGGCARCYVQFSGTLSTAAKNNLRAAGFKITLRPNYKGENQIYIGYDNATGREYCRAEAVAKVFKSAGISCYEDGDGD
jgi:hypothetical protein